MKTKAQNQQKPVAEEQDMYSFKRESGTWYIHLPAYLRQGCSKADLQMVDGAQKFLNVLSNGASTLRLRISTETQQGWDTLELIEHCGPPKGGAIYLFTPAGEQSEGSLFWICDLTLFVFGDMPPQIYIQRLP